MVNNTNILRFLRLLVLLPAVLFMFACADLDSTSTIAEIPDTEGNEETLELKQRECWQAEIVGAIYDTAGKLAMNMYSHITKGALAFMMVAFAIWLAFRMLKHVGSFTEESPAEVWTEITRKLFICLVCGILASSPQGSLFVLNSIIFPIYNAFLELGGEIVSRASEGGLAWTRESLGDDAMFGGQAGTLTQAKYDSVCTVDAVNRAAAASLGIDVGSMGAGEATALMDAATLNSFPKAPQQMMECLICSVNERLNFGYKLGWGVMKAPGFMAMICGLIVIVIFTFVKLGFVFYLVDSIFRFTMMVLILPLLIMSFAFKPTKKWATTGFLTILNSGAFMMCIAVIMFMCLAVVQQIMVDNKEMFTTNYADFADFSAPFLMLLLVCFLIVSSIGIAKTICDSLVGGGGDANFQKRVATAVATAGKFLFVKLTMGVGAVVLRNSAGARKLQSTFKKGKASLNALAGEGGGDEDEDNE